MSEMSTIPVKGAGQFVRVEKLEKLGDLQRDSFADSDVNCSRDNDLCHF